MFAQCQEMVVAESKSAVHDFFAVCGVSVYRQKTEAELKAEEKKRKEEQIAAEKANVARNQVLFFGAQNGNAQTIDRGVESGADINWLRRDGLTPLLQLLNHPHSEDTLHACFKSMLF